MKFEKMKKDIKALWLQMLRSGNYRQTREVLKEVSNTGRTKYCCLGVLTRIPCLPNHDFDEDIGRLSRKELQTSGLTDKAMDQLIYLNDHKKLPFSKIANWIEVNL